MKKPYFQLVFKSLKEKLNILFTSKVNLDFDNDTYNDQLELYEKAIFVGDRTELDSILISIQNFDVILISSFFALIFIVFFIDSRNDILKKNKKSCQIKEFENKYLAL